MIYLEISIGIVLVAAVLYYRWLYQESVIHHRAACDLHQKMLLTIMSEQVGSYFKNTLATNHVVRLNKNGKVEILIGDDDFLVPVNLDEDMDGQVALDNAYNRFIGR